MTDSEVPCENHLDYLEDLRSRSNDHKKSNGESSDSQEQFVPGQE